MSDAFDLDAYLQRIRYSGPTTANLAVLHDIIRQHMMHIPFEGIDVLLNRGVRIDAAGLTQKMIHDKRGGYCFEQSGLMRLALQAMGFPVHQGLARVWLRRNPDIDTPGAATHTSLRVEADGRTWLVDVGFGSFMPAEPIPFLLDQPLPTVWGNYGLTRTANGYLLRSLHQGEWQPLYEILEFDWQQIDFVVGNHYVAWHPNSHFRHDLNLARTTNQDRRTISGNLFRRVHPDGRPGEERQLNASELEQTIAEEFGITAEPEWLPMLDCFARGERWNSAEIEA